MTAPAMDTVDETLEAPASELVVEHEDQKREGFGTVIIERENFQRLIDVLSTRGYTVVGPTVRDQAIVYDEIASVDELPIGMTDEQAGGSYRLKPRKDDALFGYAVGPHSWKKYLHLSRILLWRSHRVDERTTIEPNEHDGKMLAFLGVRPCEVKAIAIQDKVFLGGPYVDAAYRAHRSRILIVAVDCADPGENCFCTSMQAGPEADTGYDLALTEVLKNSRHYFVARAGSVVGRSVVEELSAPTAKEDEKQAAASTVAKAAKKMVKRLDTNGIKELLQRNRDNRHWEKVATRCLTCGNCTQVCPTCFCTTVEDLTDLTGDVAERWRRWDSCFTTEFSYIHGGSIRTSARARYRQWITHKLASWIDQYGTSGCVGCGRCITWCPVGIDITEEVRAIRDSEHT